MSSGLATRVRALCLRAWFAPLVAALLTLSSLTNGLDMDDLVQRFKVRGAFGASLLERLDVFAFWPSSAAALRFKDIGYTPWFTDSDFQLAFFRPLSAVSAFVDYTLFDRWPWLMHVESVVAYALLVAVIGKLHRRFLAAPVAGVATLLYAIDDAHGYPVGWLANRNSVLASLFGALAVLAHDRARREAWRPGAWLAPGLFAVSLSSAEYGVGWLGYLVAYALILDPAPSKARRAATLAPFLGVAIAWQVAYRALHYGARGSGWYLDPVVDPIRFLAAAPVRAASLVLSQLALPPADTVGFVGLGGRVTIVVLAVLVVVVVARVTREPLRAEPALRFFALGAALALLPALGAFPADRTLLLAGIGAFAIVARVVTTKDARSKLAIALGRGWIGVHGVLAPALLPLFATVPGALERLGERGIAGFSPPADPSVTTVVVNLPNPLAGMPLIFGRDYAAPMRARVLATCRKNVTLRRTDARTLDAVVRDDEDPGPFLALFRDPARPMRTGDVFHVPGMEVEVTRADDLGIPRRASFRFDVALDDASLKWFAWNGHALSALTVPVVGASMEVGPHE